MADTSIEWTDKTWNPVRGCAIVSKGCTNCYAMKMAHRFSGPGRAYAGLTKLTKGGPVWTGNAVMAPEMLGEPLRWRKPQRIFVNSMSDLFHDDVPTSYIRRVFGVMAAAPQHSFQVLTKRPARMLEILKDKDLRWLTAGLLKLVDAGLIPPNAFSMEWPLSNVWLGVSTEDQAAADERIPLLLQAPAAVRFISAEPLLGPVDLRFLQPGDPPTEINALAGTHGVLRPHRGECAHLDWVITGGESGPGARPAHPDWFRSLRDQCAAASVPFLFKQWGNWLPTYDRDKDDPDWQRCGRMERACPTGRWLNLAGGHGFNGERVVWVDKVGKKEAGRLLDDRTWDGFPA